MSEPGAIKVLFCPPGRVPPSERWLYLGHDARARARLECRLGRPPLPLGRLLRESAKRLRGPFLDLVAGLGRAQPDPAAWWAGTLAWKSWSASDLFLLCCYLGVCERLSDAPGEEALVVVVEDPWLLAAAREALTGRPGVSFEAASAMSLWAAEAAALGLARRLRWAARMARSALLLARHGRRRAAPSAGPAVLLHSYLQERCFAGSGWDDPFFPGLEEELAREGTRLVRCTDPDATGFERALGRTTASVEPLLRHATLGGFLRALFALPPRVPAQASLDGLPVGRLLRREWWHDVSRAGRSSYLLLWDGARRLLAAAPWKALLLAWEGQPQERLLALAARERGVRVVGYQHTTVSPQQLPFFLGRGEADWAPWPDVLLASGPRGRDLLVEGGVPPGRVLLGGSRRFRLPRPGDAVSGGAGDVLVVLPVDPIRAGHLLAAAARAYPRGGEGFTFALKPHPGHHAFALPFPARLERRALPEALKDAGLVLFTSTAAGLEALALGRPVLRYRPDALLDVDPSDVLDDEQLPTTGDEDLREAVESLRLRPRRPSERVLREAYARLFAPVAPEVWRDALLAPDAAAR